ncbi:MAG: DUF4147 domain-containing protein [bacterium]|nr:DUF4147 domain-containing protein [bacterium]
MPKISNINELAKTPLRRAALEIAEAGLQAIDTERVIRRSVRIEGDTLFVGDDTFALNAGGRVVVIAIGKCALGASSVLEDILGDHLAKGTALYIGGEAQLKKMQGFRGTHPLPSDDNVRGASAILATLKGLTEADFVIFIISGGGSTLLCLPEDKGCVEEKMIVATLMRAGATIQETNTVRKHLSLARGGYLAQYAYPARSTSLIFSDVPGNDLEFIASGPTVKDTTTIADAETILSKYNVLQLCGLEKCGLVETPKDEKYFAVARALLVVSNEEALKAMEARASELGFAAHIHDAALSGESREVSAKVAGALRAAPPKTALLYGGETTVTVRGKGRGGRNLEFALAALGAVGADELVMSVASDGRDNGAFAGAISDIMTRQAADEKGVNISAALQENDGYPFFEAVGNYLVTGDTGSNVSDLIIAIKD